MTHSQNSRRLSSRLLASDDRRVARKPRGRRVRPLLFEQFETRALLATFAVDRTDDTNAAAAQVCDAGEIGRASCRERV